MVGCCLARHCQRQSIPEYVVDLFQFPFMNNKEKFSPLLKTKFKGSLPYSIPRGSVNLVGSCALISVLATFQSVPYFLLSVFENHKGDDWNVIIDYADEKINNPIRLAPTHHTMGGNYLAMEILRSYDINPRNFRISDCHYKKNYVEYFVYLSHERYPREQTTAVSQFLDKTATLMKFKSICPKRNRRMLHTCYSTCMSHRGNDIELMLNNLFPWSKSEIYSDDKLNGKFEREEFFEEDFLRNFFLIRRSISLLTVSVNYENNDYDHRIPHYDRITALGTFQFFSESARNFIREFTDHFHFKWLYITYRGAFVRRNNKLKQRVGVEQYYFRNVARVIEKGIKSSDEIVLKRLKKILVPVKYLGVYFQPSSPLNNLNIFEKELKTIHNIQDSYDITGFIFNHEESGFQLDLRYTSVLEINETHPSNELHKECVENYNNHMKDGIRKRYVHTDKKYSSIERMRILTTISQIICQNFLGINDETKKIYSSSTSHAVAIVRSTDKRSWYHIFGNLVHEIKDMKRVLPAYRYESLHGIVLSSNKHYTQLLQEWYTILNSNFRIRKTNV
ncbi:hypothetical protein SNEBB_011223 [Seison nebaliae]|nr:hypothetical protein SNEBB_011223 [Seison nebaliae]